MKTKNNIAVLLIVALLSVVACQSENNDPKPEKNKSVFAREVAADTTILKQEVEQLHGVR